MCWDLPLIVHNVHIRFNGEISKNTPGIINKYFLSGAQNFPEISLLASQSEWIHIQGR